MMAWPLIVISYLLGAVPTSYIAGRIARKIDLREHGSGNLGATNTFRVLGWRVALPVLLLDVFKGWFPTFFFTQWDGTTGAAWALAYGAAAVVGHVFPVYMRFRGGKGVATSTGVLLALAPLATAVGIATWIVVVGVTRIVSVASLAAALVIPVVVLLTEGPGFVLGLAVALTVFLFFAHRSNVRRLLKGEEHRFGQRTREVR